MASIEYKNSILWRGEDPLKARVNPALDKSKKVTRYFPGQKPSWAQEEKADEAEFLKGAKNKQKEAEARSSRRRRRDPGAAAVIEDAASSRLKRLAASSGAADGSQTERLLRHRTIHDARIIEEAKERDQEEEEDEDEDMLKKEEVKGLKDEEDLDVRGPVGELKLPADDDIEPEDADADELRALRREKARQLALARRKQEEEQLKEELPDEDEIEQEEEESEEESSDDDDLRRTALLKPVFVSKTARETVKEREALEKEEEENRVKEEAKKVERKAESKGILVDTIRAEAEAESAGLNDNEHSDGELLDDDDEKNEAEEYELWKIRELKRIKRDREERLERQKEMEMIERRRQMTDAEREADDKRLDEKSHKRDDAKNFNFLQKYYHRGGFFQDKATTGEEPLYNRDYHEPLEEEKFDKTALPKAMQLRRGQFGKKGQVKHTHLTEADTTDFSAAWSQRTKEIQKYQTRMATASGVNTFSRPSTRSADD
mmetsp:Transcript_52731/g.136157  ORF Transcript_52731/g.136157 Transcript_52731/m.136157 type:complete len:490 (+) Transcript_52731:197-1666(+)